LPNRTSSGTTCPPPTSISVSISGNTSICPGNSTTLTANVTGGTNPITYSWNTGASTSSITVSPTSTTPYSVTVTDAGGSATASVTVMVTGCNDSDLCTTDTCVPGTGCTYTPITCDDGDDSNYMQ
jgi:VCBS repeat-containing protein